MDPLEAKKEKLLARDEERAKKQSEAVRATCIDQSHEQPPNPEVVCESEERQRAERFQLFDLSKGRVLFITWATGIWRHFKCKGHYAKDRRYRYDHEEMIFTEKFNAIPVAELTVEQRAEIEQTPPVVLGKMNKFLEDEVDALVGVPSNVPPTTLVGCLFELLRSGGSQVFLRRLWNQ